MKRLLIGIFAALLSVAAFGTTLNPVQLLNPAGSSAGQAIVSTGPTTAPGWSNSLTITGGSINGAPIGATTASTGAFTTLSSSAVASLASNSTIAASPARGDTTGKIATTFYVQDALTSGSQGAAFTTLSASGNDALFYQTANAQSFTSGTPATVTTWTKVFDRVNANFNASTGTFTAPVTGIYHVAAQLTFSANTGAIATVGQVFIVANGVQVAANNFVRQTTTSTVMNCLVTADVSLTAGQTIVIQGSQNTGGAVTLNGTALVNYLSIHRVP